MVYYIVLFDVGCYVPWYPCTISSVQVNGCFSSQFSLGPQKAQIWNSRQSLHIWGFRGWVSGSVGYRAPPYFLNSFRASGWSDAWPERWLLTLVLPFSVALQPLAYTLWFFSIQKSFWHQTISPCQQLVKILYLGRIFFRTTQAKFETVRVIESWC